MMTKNRIVVLKFIYCCAHVKLIFVAKAEINLLTLYGKYRLYLFKDNLVLRECVSDRFL